MEIRNRREAIIDDWLVCFNGMSNHVGLFLEIIFIVRSYLHFCSRFFRDFILLLYQTVQLNTDNF